MTNKNTELDELEAQVEQLNRRLDRLEDEPVDDDPRRLTRRQALKAGAAGLGGLALGGAAGSSDLNPVGSAEASEANNSTSAAAVSGQVGSASSPVDVFAGSVDAESLNNIQYVRSTDSWSDVQTTFDDAGSDSVIWFEPGSSFTVTGPLNVYTDMTVYCLGCSLTMANGQTGAIFKNSDQTNGNERLTVCAYGSVFDGNRSSLTAGDNNQGVDLLGTAGSDGDTSSFCHNCFVYGGEWKQFRDRGLKAVAVEHGEFKDFEAHHNGEPGDTSQGGDGAYAARCWDFSIEGYAHTNERHGASFAGTGTARCVGCSMRVQAHDNGNDGLNAEECEHMDIVGISRDDGQDGIHAKGTGHVRGIVINHGNAVNLNAQDLTASTSNITGATGGKMLRSTVLSLDSQGNGIDVRGDGVHQCRPAVIGAANAGIAIQSALEASFISPFVENVGRFGIYLGNNSSIVATVNGGRVADWNNNDTTEAAIASGNSLGNRCTVSGVTIGDPGVTTSGTPNAVNIGGGDYHSVGGLATGGQTISVNGSNSATYGNT